MNFGKSRNRKTETEKQKAMKTKNNVQKTVLRSGAVIISFVLISFTVSAQDFWMKLLTNSSFNEIAIAMVETSKSKELPANPSKNYSDLNNSYIYEPVLKLENWMTSENYFNHSASFFANEADSPLEFENWMISESKFDVQKNQVQPLELEAWMISDSFWNR